MLEFISSIDFTAFKVVGMLVSAVTGIVMTIVSKRSVNYKKVDRKVLFGIGLYFLYMNILSTIITYALIFGVVYFAVHEIINLMDIVSLLIISQITGLIIIGIYWGIIVRKEKRISYMMGKAKELSKPLFYLINWISIYSIITGMISLPYTLYVELELILETPLFTRILDTSNWILMVWWFALLVSLVWRTSKYVFSQMKITLTDGEVIEYSCSPKMCRVHKHYLRLITRDEKGAIVKERHINEGSIKVIEYS